MFVWRKDETERKKRMRILFLSNKKRTVLASLFLVVLFAATGAAHAATLSVSAVILSKSICRFQAKAVALDFGTLDAGNPVPVNTSVTIGFVCQGSVDPASYAISDDDGLFETGPDANRMQHAIDPTQFIPYGLTLSTTSGTAPKLVGQTLTLSATVDGADYQYVAAGTYTDSVTLSINP